MYSTIDSGRVARDKARKCYFRQFLWIRPGESFGRSHQLGFQGAQQWIFPRVEMSSLVFHSPAANLVVPRNCHPPLVTLAPANVLCDSCPGVWGGAVGFPPRRFRQSTIQMPKLPPVPWCGLVLVGRPRPALLLPPPPPPSGAEPHGRPPPPRRRPPPPPQPSWRCPRSEVGRHLPLPSGSGGWCFEREGCGGKSRQLCCWGGIPCRGARLSTNPDLETGTPLLRFLLFFYFVSVRWTTCPPPPPRVVGEPP